MEENNEAFVCFFPKRSDHVEHFGEVGAVEHEDAQLDDEADHELQEIGRTPSQQGF